MQSDKINSILNTKKKKRIAGTFAIILIGLLYYAQGQVTGLYLPCLIKLHTGLLCPACGITHMAIALLQLRFYDAFAANPGLVLISPFLLIVLFTYWYAWINDKKIKSKAFYALCLFCIIFLILWAIYRNLYVFVDMHRIMVL